MRPRIEIPCCQCLYRIGFGFKRVARSVGISKKLAKNNILRTCGFEHGRKSLGGKLRRKPSESALASSRRKLRALHRRFQLASKPVIVFLKKERNRKKRAERTREQRAKINAKAWLATKRNPQRRLRQLIRARIWRVLKRVNGTKSASSLKLTGCSIIDLKAHLERQFVGRMSWDNYGRHWHIDHIIPCAQFDLTKPEEQRRCFHFTNLQPLWKYANWSKHDSFTQAQPYLL